MTVAAQPWFIRDAERFKRERDALDELRGVAGWLRGVEWRIDGDLCVDAVISAHGHDYDVRVTFPRLYPDAPASVRPLDGEVLSSHQYRDAGGTLCLEWGPDNWHRDVTAAQMLVSTYRLLDIEDPRGKDRPAMPPIAPSRHALSVGQAARSEWVRWYVSDWLEALMRSQPRASFGAFRLSCRQTTDTGWTCLVHEAGQIAGELIADPQLPPTICRASGTELHAGAWFKTDLQTDRILAVNSLGELRSLLAAYDEAGLLALDGKTPISGLGVGLNGVLVCDGNDHAHLFVVNSKDLCIRFAPVRSGTEAREGVRALPGELCEKRAGIVGLGSAGSKIAITLARMGLRNFVLVDHDIFLPENTERHALDWRHVTQHKVDGVESTLRLISSGMSIESSRLHLTGQESNAAVSGMLGRLADCDLLIDATANPRVFNLLSAAATSTKRPMVWLQIFGGGIGGFVARSRSGHEPSPLDMRLMFLQYCQEHPTPESLLASEDYSSESAEGEVLVASDADVAVIASHAARIAVDSLLPAAESIFPYSMYLIGLRRGWVFEAPFATIPISCEARPVVWQPDAATPEIVLENLTFLTELLAKGEKK